jgi:hypothetical protein
MRMGVSFVLAALTACLLAVPASAAQKLSARDRAEINAAIDTFVNHAVKRHNPGAAYGVLDAQLRGGLGQKQWAKSVLGVYPYPARDLHHPWNLEYYEGNEVGADVMLQPPLSNTKVGPIIFKIYVDHIGGRWLIDSFMPTATFAPLKAHRTKVRAVTDFSPQAGGDSSAPTGEGRISTAYLLVPFGLIGAAILGFAAWGVSRAVRNRPKRTTLPPLSIPVDDARARPSHRS